jgi:hypothetical protein
MSDVFGAIVGLLKTGSDPDVLQAQRILLRRVALEGDVAPSRIPAPKNITEIGGYVNLLDQLQQPALRAQMLAGALGVAGPSPALGFDDTGPLDAFVNIPNDRPAGASQPAIPVSITVRGDLLDSFQAALKALHAVGCMLPMLTPPRALPKAGPGVAAPNDLLLVLGRALDVVPATVLNDPDTDPLAIACLATDPPTNFQLVAREVDGGSLVPAQSWTAYKCTATTATILPAAPRRYQPLGPLLAVAGWYPVQPAVVPTNLTTQGSLTRLINVTSLVNGVTRLGDELSLVYPQDQIAGSALAGMLGWVWNGTAFTAPA